MIRIYNKNSSPLLSTSASSSAAAASSTTFVLAFETIQSKEKWTGKILDAINCVRHGNGGGDDAIPYSRHTSKVTEEDHYFESDKTSKTATSSKKTIYKEGWMQKLGVQNKSWKKR